MPYGEGGDRFAGATYDPASHYRAAAVFDFHEEVGLTPELLREVSQHQIGVLARSFDALDADPAVIRRDQTVPLDQIGGFLALEAPAAGVLAAALHREGVFTDYRGRYLVPYLPKQKYLLWVGGSGLVDSPLVAGEPVTIFNLTGVAAPTDAAAEKYSPAI